MRRPCFKSHESSNMIAIKDRNTETGVLPLAELLVAVLRHTEISPNTVIQLIRFGGAGGRVWYYESKLDAGETTALPMVELSAIVSDSTQCVDEMHCLGQGCQFGLSDATFLLFQSLDKSIEGEVSAEFHHVTTIADH